MRLYRALGKKKKKAIASGVYGNKIRNMAAKHAKTTAYDPYPKKKHRLGMNETNAMKVNKNKYPPPLFFKLSDFFKKRKKTPTRNCYILTLRLGSVGR